MEFLVLGWVVGEGWVDGNFEDCVIVIGSVVVVIYMAFLRVLEKGIYVVF